MALYVSLLAPHAPTEAQSLMRDAFALPWRPLFRVICSGSSLPSRPMAEAERGLRVASGLGPGNGPRGAEDSEVHRWPLVGAAFPDGADALAISTPAQRTSHALPALRMMRSIVRTLPPHALTTFDLLPVA